MSDNLRCIVKYIAVVFAIWIVNKAFVVYSSVGNLNYEGTKMKTKLDLNFQTVRCQKNLDVVKSNFQVWSYLEGSDNMRAQIYRSLSTNDSPPGDMGKPVIISKMANKNVKSMVKHGWDEYSFNSVVSDIIPFDRRLPDYRSSSCKDLGKYMNNLPQASVIICFYNEAKSTLLRTVHSVINRSPKHLLREIILVDDHSTKGDLKTSVEDYLKKNTLIKIIRLNKREGLIRARIEGVKEATAPVVIFLDSHCECTEGWLIPLINRVTKYQNTIAFPKVDIIYDTSFEYVHQSEYELYLGGFDWLLNFKWTVPPSHLLLSMKTGTEAIPSPVMPGGLFAIRKSFFEHLGYYDDGLEIWGGENFELSFKAWMCGGRIEIVPCSHVGHVFRKSFSYITDNTRRNLIRVAENQQILCMTYASPFIVRIARIWNDLPESVLPAQYSLEVFKPQVWMDNYKHYFYERIGRNLGDYGNVTRQKMLRQKLQCKSFEWYRQTVYPQLEIPGNYVASGEIINMAYHGHCMQSNFVSQQHKNVQLNFCHHHGDNQFFTYTSQGLIQQNHMCLDRMKNIVMFELCDYQVKSQIWIYKEETKHVRHAESQMCLEVRQLEVVKQLVLDKCRHSRNQEWMFENYDGTKFATSLRMLGN